MCTPGFYCGENTLSPLYCCPGYFCETPKSIQICPIGHFCPAGTVKPIACGLLTHCGLGTSSVARFGYIIIVVLLFSIIAILFALNDWRRKHKSKRYQVILDGLSKIIELEEAELSDSPSIAAKMSFIDLSEKNEKNASTGFDVQFENIGLSLPDGRTFLKGVSGSIRAGRTLAIMV